MPCGGQEGNSPHGWTVNSPAAFGGGEAADDADERATGPDADRAAAAALARFPGGRVTAVERDDDDGGGWEVEMTRGDGATVDVDVDRSFGIVAVDDPE